MLMHILVLDGLLTGLQTYSGLLICLSRLFWRGEVSLSDLIGDDN